MAPIYDLSLNTAAAELKYERSSHLVDIISKDEDIRKLRFELHVQADDIDELRDLLAQEESRSEHFERILNENLTRADDAEARLSDLELQLRSREHEVGALEAEKKALATSAADSETILTEKLALTRELSLLRPQLEHLKQQAASTETLMTEKLDLQRQLTNVQCELENAKRDVKRAMAKRRNTEDVRRDLLKEKKAKAKLEERIEELQEELEKEKKRVAKAAKQTSANSEADELLDELRQELAAERKERAKVEKQSEKQSSDFESQKATLEEKLNQFRMKLRTTKEKLKQTEADLAAAQEEAEAQPAKKGVKTAANAKKRSAAHFDADATNIGTPGDGPAAKRGRKATANVGEKSTFSMTPFLNKTASILPEDSDNEHDPDKPIESIEIEAPAESPIVEKAVATKQKKQPLATADANAQKPKPAPRQRKQKAVMPQLELITEEEDVHSQGQENAPAVKPAGQKLRTKTADGPVDAEKAKKQKKRKSLVDFATFNKPEEAKKVQSKKNRKLGGTGKTLFDEEDEAPAKALPGRTLLGGRGFGGLAPGAKKAGGFLGASKIGSSLLMTAQDGSGFQFSPLKRRKGNLDDTLRG
ncbi:uncharacterized protein MYCFIDRAFT_81397 [Pseudocercospora fijiensis CIRAD86]|uniref:Uncharacterized protein n=1 Tax=Pseudocercospora fijiensis (strain CIRAD86) TaxID=383855 RepID=M2YUD0_PSEFD|nr:uncharacterized protein MYCFIDRAFT_81397 [Pseudocercospora fijiensis CIRAD86]EME81330.1 hypothetical protein MYCFIDRAFT_81397 [Pseudocercospora fijiensis CIRAD86]